MEYLKIEGEFPKLANCAVTMGKFDGIHRGHRKLVEKIRERKTLGEQAVLFAIDASSNIKQLFQVTKWSKLQLYMRGRK